MDVFIHSQGFVMNR